MRVTLNCILVPVTHRRDGLWAPSHRYGLGQRDRLDRLLYQLSTLGLGRHHALMTEFDRVNFANPWFQFFL